MEEMQSHHAYPRECPFPHVSGTTSPMSPEEWMEHHGIDDVEATMEEMQSHHARLEHETESQEQLSLPWTHVEELVAHHHEGVSTRAWTISGLRWIMAVSALASFALPLLRASKAAVSSCSVGKDERCLV